VNVLSTQRVNRAALPQLRKQGRGLLVWVSSSSVAGGTPPYLSPYFAAKAGMDALAVLYAREVALWVSRLRLSCQARLRKAPTTSRMPACRRTRTASPNTKPGHIVSAALRSHRAGRSQGAPSAGGMRGAARPPRGSGGTPPVGGDAVVLYTRR
jgi:hypothetical protein